MAKSKRKKPINSKRKGSSGERLLCAFLKELGFASARRTQQYNGLGDSDVVCEELDEVHIECKVGAATKWDVGVKILTEACNQARRDAKGKPWVVFWKPDRKCWRLTTEMQPEGCPIGLATVTDTDAMKAILISKQHLRPEPKAKRAARPKPVRKSASGYRNPLKRR